MDNIEKRLQNTELVLFALWAIVQDLLPPDYLKDGDKLMQEYFDTNVSLESKINADFVK